MAMLYVQRDDQTSPAGSTRAFLALIVVFLLGLTFVPGLPKGAAIGHEWVTPRAGAPLMLPLVRPVFLSRGETITIEYTAQVRQGRFAIGITAAPNPLMLFFASPLQRIASLGISGSGTASFTARETGIYLLRVIVEPIGGNAAACQSLLGDFLDAAMAKATACPNANASYSVIVY